MFSANKFINSLPDEFKETIKYRTVLSDDLRLNLLKKRMKFYTNLAQHIEKLFKEDGFTNSVNVIENGFEKLELFKEKDMLNELQLFFESFYDVKVEYNQYIATFKFIFN